MPLRVEGRDIHKWIRKSAGMIQDPAGRQVEVLKDMDAFAIASQFGIVLHRVYQEALGLGIWPYRYIRNRETLSVEEQRKLSMSCVSVVGAGGLGGHLVLLLARMGIGHLIVVDHDCFDETNLNRQMLACRDSLGKSKSEEAAAVVAAVNPGVQVTPYQLRIDAANAEEILDKTDVVVDALDNIPGRLVIEDAARSRGIPLVHGALAGLEGQVMTIFPGDRGLKGIYRSDTPGDDPGQAHTAQSPEAILGVPALTPAIIATLQAAEVFKILLKRGTLLRNVLVHVDLEVGELSHFRLEEETCPPRV